MKNHQPVCTILCFFLPILTCYSQACFNLPSIITGVNEVWSIVSADFNEDGNTDLACPVNYNQYVNVYLGNGTGGFGAATAFPMNSSVYSIATGDFNSDGHTDIASANQS
ncbi:MAG TPA: VCBS repeat-containing protein, partial [Bacteroidia bacterium]|nr:VCBS repeat-containing protein [Bacteroidia bacterium]